MRKLAVVLAAAVLTASGASADAAYRHHDGEHTALRTAGAVGLGYLLFPWSLLFPVFYGGPGYLEPIAPPEPSPASAAAKPPCVKTNVAHLANACPAVAAKAG